MRYKHPSWPYLGRQVSDLESSERKPRWTKTNFRGQEQDGKSQQELPCFEVPVYHFQDWKTLGLGLQVEQIFPLLCLHIGSEA